MAQPMPALLLTLLVGTAAAAQPFPLVRERVERRATLPASPREAVLEVRIARDVLTNIILDAPVERASVELEGRVSHFRLVEVAERMLTLEPSVELAPEERLGLRMRLKDGTAVALVLTAHPTQVDTRVDVARPLPPEAVRAELAEAKARLAALQAQCGEEGPVGLVLSGRLDGAGVSARPFTTAASSESGAEPHVVEGTGYRAGQWALVDMALRLPPGKQALVTRRGAPRRARGPRGASGAHVALQAAARPR